MSDRTDMHILLMGNVTPQTVSAVALQLMVATHYREQKEINLVMMGHGGDGDSCAALCDVIEQVQANGLIVKGHVLGYVMSANAIVLQACRPYRYMSRWGHLMIHGPTYSYEGMDYEDIQAMKKHETHNDGNFLELIYKSKMDKATVDAVWQSNKPTWFNAEQALALDLIDYISDTN